VTRLLVGLTLMTVTTQPVAAQRVAITPIVGAYLPLKIQASSGQSDVCDPPCPTTVWNTKLAPGPAFGIKAAVTWDASIGVEASFAYGATSRQREATSTEAGEPPAPSPGQTTVAALRMTVTRPVFASAAVTLGAGFALNTLSGSGYESSDAIDDQSLLGLSLAGALRMKLGSAAHFEVGVASSFYSVEQSADPILATAFPQHDMIISVGLAWALGK